MILEGLWGGPGGARKGLEGLGEVLERVWVVLEDREGGLEGLRVPGEVSEGSWGGSRGSWSVSGVPGGSRGSR